MMKRLRKAVLLVWIETGDLLQMTVKYYKDKLHESSRDFFYYAFQINALTTDFWGLRALQLIPK